MLIKFGIGDLLRVSGQIKLWIATEEANPKLSLKQNSIVAVSSKPFFV
jgi:hypothetical protein